ncbi:thiamine transport system ATP-binding protein [Devosia enhydra]|uniref:Thiamine transport system ATP-binding protein n=1 Tax=Devosia enhydra TaxID=665118 RepID=A0A1K2HSP9_9HYPH|nr:ATP-binding cassette domain-containing protein [Devosia enhydra]SFZ80877.1 thiamine transport system ATP-binding protein [Devosia enhydra]
MLVLEDLRFGYGRDALPYRFSMTAPRGAVTAISGASGSGKSTLLDLIAGFLTPEAGRLTMDGVDLVPLPPEARPLSILFQSDALFDHLSAEQNVALGLPRARQGERETIRAALGEVGLGHLDARKAAALSGGERQRVALARTLLRDRPLLLLDEPFSALDDETRGSVRALVQRLTIERNWATLLVSHNRDDVEAIAKRRYRLSERVLAED